MAALQPFVQVRHGPGGSGKGGNSYRGVPQAKIDMIGRLGEIAVYRWLKSRLPLQDIDSGWV